MSTDQPTDCIPSNGFSRHRRGKVPSVCIVPLDVAGGQAWVNGVLWAVPEGALDHDAVGRHGQGISALVQLAPHVLQSKGKMKSQVREAQCGASRAVGGKMRGAGR